MWGRRRTGTGERSGLAWIGLLLMAVSFIWLQVTAVPRSLTPLEPEPPPAAPFAIVIIDAGHGGQDSGTTKNGIAEKDLTLDVAHRVERLLQERGRNNSTSLPTCAIRRCSWRAAFSPTKMRR